MQLRSIVSAVAIACATFSGAASAANTSLGNLVANQTVFIGNFSLGSGAFSDTYTFQLPFLGNQGGGLFGFGFATPNPLTVVSLVTLTGAGYNFSDDSPSDGFNFSAIPAFTPLTLSVFGTTAGASGGYFGTLTTSVSAVPEPGSMALLLAGLGVVGFVARRRKMQ